MEYKDYYRVLGVSKTSTETEIRKAFRKLARQYHPDLNPGDKASEERFKEMNEAYEVLGDPDKRRKYDELGSNWEEIQRNREYARRYAEPGFEGSSEEFDLGDFFTTFFGRRAAGFQADPFASGPRRGADLEFEISITLEDLYHGGKKALRVPVGEVCAQCEGRGMRMESSLGGGRRRVISSARPCPVCRGTGRIANDREIQVAVPKGVQQGSRIRLAGMGEKGVEGRESGDLYLVISVIPHRIFRLDGYDLEADLPLWPEEAALGTQISIPTLDKKVLLKIPPGTPSGTRLRLAGKGLPMDRRGGSGDLYYRTRIVVPARMDSNERSLFSELKRLRREGGEIDSIRKHLG